MKLDSTKLICLFLAYVGPSGAPSGEVYARLMSDGVELDSYQAVLRSMKESGLVSESAYYLTLTKSGLELLVKIVAIISEEIISRSSAG